MAMAIDPTPARVNACAPRPSVSSAARAAATSNDHSRTIAGFPLNAASDRVAAGDVLERKVRRRKRFVHPGGTRR